MIKALRGCFGRGRDGAATLPHVWPHTLVITGAAGEVASAVRPRLRASFANVRLTDCLDVRDLAANECFAQARLEDPDSFVPLLRGADAILHLGGIARNAPLRQLTAVNVIALEALLERAAEHGVSRVVLASSMHVLGLYRRDEPVQPWSPPRADSSYAASKVMVEQLGHIFAQHHGLGIASVRIGCLKPRREDSEPGGWIGPTDLARLFELALTHPDIRDVVINGVAEHSGDDCGQRWLRDTFGFRFTEPGLPYRQALQGLARWFPSDPIAREFRGGQFASGAV